LLHSDDNGCSLGGGWKSGAITSLKNATGSCFLNFIRIRRIAAAPPLLPILASSEWQYGRRPAQATTRNLTKRAGLELRFCIVLVG